MAAKAVTAVVPSYWRSAVISMLQEPPVTVKWLKKMRVYGTPPRYEYVDCVNEPRGVTQFSTGVPARSDVPLGAGARVAVAGGDVRVGAGVAVAVDAGAGVALGVGTAAVATGVEVAVGVGVVPDVAAVGDGLGVAVAT